MQTGKRAALVYNPVKTDAHRLRALVAQASTNAGWERPLLLETRLDDLGSGVTRQALQDGVDAVMVAGGDGTVRAVSEAMVGSGVPLTILPSGTGNLLARNLRLPLDDLAALIAATFDGERRGIDVGLATLSRPDGATEERAFVVIGGVGLDAAMIANTSGALKKRVGWVAYVDGATRALVGAKPFPVDFRLDGGRSHHAAVHSVLFANCGSLPGGLELIPAASFTDGLLDVAVIQPKNAFAWLLVWRRVAWGNRLGGRLRRGSRIRALWMRDRSVRYGRGSEMSVALEDPHPVQLDGDEFGLVVHVDVRVEVSGLLVAVPHGHVLPG